MTTKEQFIEEHNILSPTNLQASVKMLDYFESKKPSLFRDDDYPIEKIRRPFLFWLTSLSDKEKEIINA